MEAVAKSTGRKQSEVIREAVDRFLDLARGNGRKAILDKAAGMWRDRRALPDFEAARRSWDRG